MKYIHTESELTERIAIEKLLWMGMILAWVGLAGCDRLEQNYVDVDPKQPGWHSNVHIIEGTCPQSESPDCCVGKLGQEFYVTVTPNLSPRNENDCLAHELKHIAFGPRHVGE